MCTRRRVLANLGESHDEQRPVQLTIAAPVEAHTLRLARGRRMGATPQAMAKAAAERKRHHRRSPEEARRGQRTDAADRGERRVLVGEHALDAELV